MEWIVVKTFVSLAAVIALMVGVVFVMKKYLYGGKSSSANIVDMKVIGTMMLQPKRSVSVLKVMDKVLIIGVTEAGMETLGEINDRESVKEIDKKIAAQSIPSSWSTKKAASTLPEKDAPMSFAEALSMQLRKLGTKGSS